MRHVFLRYAAGTVLTLMASFLPSCAPPEEPPESTSVTQTTLSFLALGDSYTIGESVDSAQRWPVQLARRLREEGVPVSDPVIIARTGWTTDELEAGIREADPRGPFGFVTLLIGVNNQYRGRDVEEFRVQFRTLLRQALSFAGERADRVLVLSIPDWGVMPFAAQRDRDAIAVEIDLYNQVKAQESARMNVRFVDITEISRDALGDAGLVAEDGLHPSGEQYALWVEAALPVADTLLHGGGGDAP